MADYDGGEPNFGARLGRVLVTLLKALFFLVVIAAIIAGSWIAFREIRRSLDAANTSAAANKQRIELLRSDVDNLMSDTANEEALATVAAEIAALEGQLEDTIAQLNAGLERQDARLDALRVQVGSLITRTDTLTLALSSSQSDMLALQGDLNETNMAVDDVGGGLDQVASDLEALSAQFEAVRSDAVAVTAMQEALTLFRAWEMMARARLSLLQGNAGAAADEVRAAQALVTAVAGTTVAPGELAALSERLALVQSNLPDDPLVASRDLESAWEILDRELARLTGGPASLAPAPALSLTPTLTTTATLTPVATATPAATATATPSP